MDKKIAGPETLETPEKPIFLKRILPHSFVNHFVTNVLVTVLLIGGVFFLDQVRLLSHQVDSLSHHDENATAQFEGKVHEQLKAFEANLETLQHQSKDQPAVDTALVDNLQQKLAHLTEEQKLLQTVLLWDFLKQQVKKGLPYHEEWVALKPLLQDFGVDLSLEARLEKAAETGLKRPEIKEQTQPLQPITVTSPPASTFSEDWISWLRSLVRIEKIGPSPSDGLDGEVKAKPNASEILKKVQHLLQIGDLAAAIQFVESQKESLVGTGLEDWLVEAYHYRDALSDLDRIEGEIKKKFLKMMPPKGEK